jgi:hypothetical protein
MKFVHCCNATLSFAARGEPGHTSGEYLLSSPGDTVMKQILKATLFGLGLAAGAAGLAQAQSVSSLPPDTAAQGQYAPTGQTPRTYPYGSTQSFYPKPGGSEVLSQPTYQPPAVPPQSQAGQPYPNGPSLH